MQFLNLLAAVARSPQWKEHGLRSAAYEAIGALIRCGANDTVPSVLQVLPHLLTQLASTFQMSASDEIGRDNLQQNLCLVIHLAVLKIEGLVMNVNEATGNMLSDDIMTLLLQVRDQFVALPPPATSVSSASAGDCEPHSVASRTVQLTFVPSIYARTGPGQQGRLLSPRSAHVRAGDCQRYGPWS